MFSKMCWIHGKLNLIVPFMAIVMMINSTQRIHSLAPVASIALQNIVHATYLDKYTYHD